MAADSGTRTLVRPRRRIASLDALRGLTLVSMIGYHACWDLVYLFHADWDWYRGTGAYIWQQSICWTFILLSGFCFSLGRRPLRRGLTVFGCGWVVTLVTVLFMPEEQIWFGVLTLIGSLHAADGPTGKTAAARTCGVEPRRQRGPVHPAAEREPGDAGI